MPPLSKVSTSIQFYSIQQKVIENQFYTRHVVGAGNWKRKRQSLDWKYFQSRKRTDTPGYQAIDCSIVELEGYFKIFPMKEWKACYQPEEF